MDEDRFHELTEDVTVIVERSITLRADLSSVWEHLTDGDLVGDWMEGEVTFEARPGGAITMTPEGGDVVWGTVEEVIPSRRLQWSWRTDHGLPTQVEIELEPVEDGTVLTVRETLLPWTTTGLPPRWMEPPGPMAWMSTAA